MNTITRAKAYIRSIVDSGKTLHDDNPAVIIDRLLGLIDRMEMAVDIRSSMAITDYQEDPSGYTEGAMDEAAEILAAVRAQMNHE